MTEPSGVKRTELRFWKRRVVLGTSSSPLVLGGRNVFPSNRDRREETVPRFLRGRPTDDACPCPMPCGTGMRRVLAVPLGAGFWNENGVPGRDSCDRTCGGCCDDWDARGDWLLSSENVTDP
jgi:hypothetical protein